MLSQQSKIPIQVLRTPPTTERVSSVSSAIAVLADKNNVKNTDSPTKPKAESCGYSCNSRKYCHSGDFGGYCTMFVQNQFCLNPGI